MSEMVSVIIPTYNRKYIIQRAIESVMRQTHSDWEILIIDDAGTDGTGQWIRKNYGHNSNIRYIRCRQNGGPSRARNIGMKRARGNYIAFLDSDDEWLETHLEECIDAMRKTGYQIASGMWSEEKDGQLYHVEEYEWFQYAMQKTHDELGLEVFEDLWKFDSRFFEYLLFNGCYCYQISGVVMKRMVLDYVGFFNENMRLCEDIEFLHRVFALFPLVTVKNRHFIYHYGNDNLYAFVDRDRMPVSRTIKSKYVKKMSRNLLYKIDFYKEMRKTALTIPCYHSEKEISTFVEYQLFTLCLSLALLNQENARIRTAFLLRAVKHMKSKQALKLWLGYKKKENIEVYYWQG